MKDNDIKDMGWRGFVVLLALLVLSAVGMYFSFSGLYTEVLKGIKECEARGGKVITVILPNDTCVLPDKKRSE